MSKPVFTVACIGSREISDATFDLLKEVGRQIALRGWRLASGNALGSDFAYASGANEIDPDSVHLFLPWRTYNHEQLAPGNNCYLDIHPEWEKLAKVHHPKYDQLTQGAKKMMDRNAGIILNSHVTCAVLNPIKIGGGGTGHGWRISKALGKPMLDLTNFEKGQPNLTQVVAALESLGRNFEESQK